MNTIFQMNRDKGAVGAFRSWLRGTRGLPAPLAAFGLWVCNVLEPLESLRRRRIEKLSLIPIRVVADQRPVRRRRTPMGFTLIELMIVIAIIAILAALVFPIAGAAKKAQIRNRAKVEMAAVETAIEQYKTKLGFYPPDNAPNWAANQLYFELLGTTNTGSAASPNYQTLDGSASVANFTGAFGTGTSVSGIMNCSKGGEDGTPAQNFAKNVKPAQFMVVTNNAGAQVIMALGLQGSGTAGPTMLGNPTSPGLKLNPWCYNSSSPRYNPKSFDLWIDIIIAGQTNRICNWSERAIIVSTPY